MMLLLSFFCILSRVRKEPQVLRLSLSRVPRGTNVRETQRRLLLLHSCGAAYALLENSDGKETMEGNVRVSASLCAAISVRRGGLFFRESMSVVCMPSMLSASPVLPCSRIRQSD